MAEAEGPPRKTSTYKDFSGMNSQDGRYGVEPNEFFFLENIMRVADSKLRSVPGPVLIPNGVFPPGDETIFVLGDSGGDFLGSVPDLDLLRQP
jgi:hypothetical protein